MKTVLVVGAGPAGLVAAKTLLQHAGGKKFKVTIFEAAGRVGGMWRALPGETGEKCSPHMPTNLSRFTVAFSDLSWSSVDLSDPATGAKSGRDPPMFPQAWQVGRYLEAYAKTFIPPGVILFNREVIDADLQESNSSQPWKVTSYDRTANQHHDDVFDYLIVASGFFGGHTKKVEVVQNATPIQPLSIEHSAEFRYVASLVNGDNGDVAVIGGGISGSEAAATAALQISSAKFSPGVAKAEHTDRKVYHVFDRPFYCLPRYLPRDPHNPGIQDYTLAPKFLPLDLLLYDLSRRGADAISASIGLVPPEKAKKGHHFLRSVIGGDQRDLGHPELVYTPDNTGYPAFTGISDTYAEFVRSGLIVPVQGRARTISHQGTGLSPHRLTIEISQQERWSNLASTGTSHSVGNLSGIIEATGFDTHPTYVSPRVREKLDHDPDCSRVPFLLSRASIFHSGLPTLAFIGFYEGPYWGVMEMQARLVARNWQGASEQDPGPEVAEITESQLVRRAIKERASEVPQFWMADYVGIIEELARKAGAKRDDSCFDGQNGPTFPARYQSPDTREEASRVVDEVARVLRLSSDGRYVAAATFRGMQGKWILQRKIDSRHSSMMGGTFNGTARFHPRTPTNPQYSAEYLYVEEGTLTMDNGLAFPATRRYVYRYEEPIDTITAWFVEEDGLIVANLFNTWAFIAPKNEHQGWLAEGDHWCSPDTYKNRCEFRFRGASLNTFGIKYDVIGPKKDYTHESWYTRSTPSSEW